MQFVTEADLYGIIKKDVLDQIVEPTDASETAAGNLNDAEAKAKSEVIDYLNTRYDCAAIFNKSGTDRHASIVRIMCQLHLYYAHKRSMPHKVPEVRQMDYDNAIKWLRDVRDGKTAPLGLPPLENESGEVLTQNRYGNSDGERLTGSW